MKAPRIVTVGGIDIQGNAGSRLVGGVNVTVAGDSKHGYAICSTCPGEDQGTPTGGVNNMTPTINGACCIDGVCHITNAAACANAGGDYQGDGTDCDPDPCGTPLTGACCAADDTCTDGLTESECNDDGGHYQGNGSACFTDPCDICNIIIPSTVTFAGVTIGCCINYGGSSSLIVPCFGGGTCSTINTGFALHPNGSPPPTYGHGVLFGDASDGVAGSYDFFTNEDCSGSPDASQGSYQWTIWVECNRGDYPGFALGWFVVAFDIASNALFFADGIADPTIPFANLLTCGVPNATLASEFPSLFPASTGGTAVLS